MDSSSSRRRVPLVDMLSVMFGIGAWISINGLWVELPLLVQALPEGWSLPSYMSIVIQIANIGLNSFKFTFLVKCVTLFFYVSKCRPIGPIFYSVMHLLVPHIVHEKPSIYVLMVVGILSSLLIAFFWDATSYVNGEEHSTGLLTLLFFLSLVDCSSSVLFMPFMARFRQAYLTSYLIGEGLSGFLPSIFALIQGVGGNPSCRNTSAIINGSESWQVEAFYPEPNFSVSAFFFILMGLMVCCAASFIGLNHCSVARRERYESVATRIPVAIDNQTFVASSELVDPTFNGKSTKINYHVELDTVSEEQQRVNTDIPKSVFIYLLTLQAWVCALSNGALPSIQSYSCLPYGNTAYHFAVTLSAMANPLSCLIAYFLPITNVCLIAMFAFLGTSVSAYIIALAALSPVPPLIGYPSGETLMVRNLWQHPLLFYN